MDLVKSIWQNRFLHCILFGLYPVLFLFARNSAEINAGELFLPLLVIAVILTISYFAVSLIINGSSASIAVSIVIVHLFAFGQLISVLHGFDFIAAGIHFDAVLLGTIIWHLSLVILLFMLFVKRGQWKKMTIFLNVAASALIMTQLVTGFVGATPQMEQNNFSGINNSGNTTVKPDIYYIILDGYGGQQALKDIYGYDNSELINGLERLGFYVAKEARSNYSATDQSLTSSLNMNYLHNLAELDPGSSDRSDLADLFENNVVTKVLKSQGYKIVTFTSGFSLTELKDADLYLNPGLTLSDFQSSLLSMTPAPYLTALTNTQFDLHRNRINYNLGKLSDIKSSGQPMFVFDHIVCPHPPFVFNADGTPRNEPGNFSYSDGSHFFENGGSLDEYIDGYKNQASYISKTVLTAVENILNNSTRPVAIIIQGDHGPGSGLNWQNAGKSNLYERFSILNAYYFSDQDYSALELTTTPINSFRILFNKYFKAGLELLPERSLFTARTRPYLFIDVTSYIEPNTGS